MIAKEYTEIYHRHSVMIVISKTKKVIISRSEMTPDRFHVVYEFKLKKEGHITEYKLMDGSQVKNEFKINPDAYIPKFVHKDNV